MTAIKVLLGVRKSTPEDLCLILKCRVESIQHKFYSKIIYERQDLRDDPFTIAWNLVKGSRTSGARYIESVLALQDIVTSDRITIKQKVTNATGTKYVVYREQINPHLDTRSI